MNKRMGERKSLWKYAKIENSKQTNDKTMPNTMPNGNWMDDINMAARIYTKYEYSPTSQVGAVT